MDAAAKDKKKKNWRNQKKEYISNNNKTNDGSKGTVKDGALKDLVVTLKKGNLAT